MESKAVLKNLGISAKKVRIPAEVVRGMNVVEALSILQFMRKGAAEHVAKVVKSAAANAQNKEGVNLADLYIYEIKVDKGNARIKHFHPRAKGGGYYMWLRGKSHITVVLKDRNETKIDESKPRKTETVSEEVSNNEVKVSKSSPKTKKQSTMKSSAKAEKAE